MRMARIGSLLLALVWTSARGACPTSVELLRPAILQETGTPVPPICVDVLRGDSAVTAILFSNNIGMRLVTTDAGGGLLSSSREVMFGSARGLELIDLDRDGVPEVVASGITPHAVVYWVFSIDATGHPQLLSLSSVDGPITDPEILDLGPSEGMLVIDVKEGSSLDEDGERTTEWLYTPYTMTAGKLTADASMSVLSLAHVRRERARPTIGTITFATDDTSSQARLTLLNGTPGGSGRCSSGIITVNGVALLTESAFSQHIYRKDVSFFPLADNALTAELRSGPDCEVALLLTQDVVK